MVNLAGRTLLYGLLKFKVGFVAKLFYDLSQSVLLKVKTFIASKSLKLSFTLNCVLNDFILTRFAFDVLQKFDDVQLE